MRDVKQVQDELMAHGFKGFSFVHKELKWVAKNVDDSEELLAGVRGFRGCNTVLALLTSKQVILVDAGMLYGVRSASVPLRLVNQVSVKSGMFFSQILIANGVDTISMSGVFAASAEAFSTVIHRQLADLTPTIAAPQSQPATSSSDKNLDQLKEYWALYKTGSISLADYQKVKDQILQSVGDDK